MRSLLLHLHAAGVVAPGLNSLDALRAACRSGSLPAGDALSLAPPAQLPANERRRATQVVRLTLACIEQALAGSQIPTDELRSVFATDEGTGEVCEQMLEALSTTRQVSPMVFANSVLNAPSGYYSIAYRNRGAATVVSAGLESFAAGLLCAATEIASTGQPVLLVAYDPPMTTPVDELLPVRQPTASAWVLSQTPREQDLATFCLAVLPGAEPDAPLPRWMPPAWAAHSSARSLAALALIDAAQAGEAAGLRLRCGGVAVHLQVVAS